jgi:hypothetical protein
MKKQRKWAVILALLLAASPFVWAAGVLLSVEKKVEARNGAAVIGSDFLDALATHKYDKAHELLTFSQQRAISVSQIQQAESQVEKKYGKPTHEPEIDEYAVDKDFKGARFLYDNTYQHKEDLLLVALVYVDRKWQVTEYRYDYNPT